MIDARLSGAVRRLVNEDLLAVWTALTTPIDRGAAAWTDVRSHGHGSSLLVKGSTVGLPLPLPRVLGHCGEGVSGSRASMALNASTVDA